MVKVLLIDDNLFSLKIYQEMLDKIGYQVITARGGNEGVKKFSEAFPDYVLCDIMMPDMDGFTVFEKIHQLSSKVTFFFLSANIQESSRIRAREIGATGFIPKPTTIEELAALLKPSTETTLPESPR